MDAPAAARDKAAWRREARRIRAGLDAASWSQELVETLRAWPRYRAALTVLSYVAFGSEPDLGAVEADGARVAVPRLMPGAGHLVLHTLGGEMVRHPLGMLEPSADAPRVDPQEVDLALLPGLAFDTSGGRLGYGAGHYDRLLPLLRPDVPRVGVTHPSLVADALPLEAHDVRATHLLLPNEIRTVTEPDASASRAD